jgi:hypothetical protein
MGRNVMLPSDAALPAQRRPLTTTTTAGPATGPSTPVSYERPSTDQIIVRLRSDVPGALRVLESWDPGWRATVDGAPADTLCADDVFLAVALPPGAHEVRFTFSTPGARTGIGMSLASLCLLAIMAAFTAGAEPDVVGVVGIDKQCG